VAPIVHRRLLALVKHPEGGPIADYLVVRDETAGDQPGQINIHLLGREASTPASDTPPPAAK